MAQVQLADATFAWFADADAADIAVGPLTVDGVPSAGTTAPVNNGDSSYGFTPSESLQYTLTSDEFLSGGTGDLTLAIRARWDTTNLSGSNRSFHIGNVPNARGLAVEMFSSVGKNPGVILLGPNSRANMSVGITEGVPFIFVVRRQAGAFDFWLDQVKDPAPTDAIGASDLNNTYEDATVGALNGGSGNNLDGALWFAVAYDGYLSDADCASIDEATLRAALLGPTVSAVNGPPTAYPLDTVKSLAGAGNEGTNTVFGSGLPSSPTVRIEDAKGVSIDAAVTGTR